MTEKSEASGAVLYDEACGFCLRTVAWMRPLLEPRGFGFRPLPEGMEKIEMKLVLPDGRTLGGADAVVALARAVGWLRPLAVLGYFPGVMPLLRVAYRKVAAQRHCLSGVCGWTPPGKPV